MGNGERRVVPGGSGGAPIPPQLIEVEWPTSKRATPQSVLGEALEPIRLRPSSFVKAPPL